MLLYWIPSNFAVKAIHQFDENIITCQLVTGKGRWYIFRCYLEPGDGVTIRDVGTAINERSRGEDLIVAGDFDADLERTGGRAREK